MSRQIIDFEELLADEAEGTDLVPVEDRDIPRTKKMKLEQLATILADLKTPIGSTYFNVEDDTNPATLLGFGVWELFGTGRTIVGVDTSQTEFASPGQVGGTKTNTMTEAQMPSHAHAGTTSGVGDHAHGLAGDPVYTSGVGNQRAAIGGSGQQFRWSAGGVQPAGGHAHSFTTDSRGGNQAQNNLQPYVTLYMWKRTG